MANHAANDLHNNDFFNIFPNPSDGRTSLIFEECSERIKCEVYNSKGQILTEKEYINVNLGQDKTMDLSK